MTEFLSALGPFIPLIFILVCAAYYTIRHLTFDLPLRRLRAENIARNGWPPPHLDADGDFKPEPKKDEE